MVQRQFLILGASVSLLSHNVLLSGEQPATPPPESPVHAPDAPGGASAQPAAAPAQSPPQDRGGHGFHGWGFFTHPPGPPGQPSTSPDHAHNWMAERALMFMLMEAPPAELEKQLAGWPKFQAMTDAEKQHFRARLEGYRKNRQQVAMHAATQMGIQIRPEQEETFIRDFWRGRRKIEETLFREMEPRRRELEGKFREEILGKYNPKPQ